MVSIANSTFSTERRTNSHAARSSNITEQTSSGMLARCHPQYAPKGNSMANTTTRILSPGPAWARMGSDRHNFSVRLKLVIGLFDWLRLAPLEISHWAFKVKHMRI